MIPALFKNHLLWWSLLLTGTLLVSLITTKSGLSIYSILNSMAGHFFFAAVIAAVPALIFWLVKRPLSTHRIMVLFTVGWTILAVANVWAMP